MELNKENMKKIRWLIAFSVLLYLGVQNLDVVLKYAKIVWGLLLPFVLGGAMAFVLNVPMAFIERHVFGKAKEKEDRRTCSGKICKTGEPDLFHCSGGAGDSRCSTDCGTGAWKNSGKCCEKGGRRYSVSSEMADRYLPE